MGIDHTDHLSEMYTICKCGCKCKGVKSFFSLFFSCFFLPQMKEAFAKQLANEDYQRFLKKVPRVEGVWDDHDYGGERKLEPPPLPARLIPYDFSFGTPVKKWPHQPTKMFSSTL